MINEAGIAKYITTAFPNVETADNFGYTFFFCGSDHKLPFATLASSDNEYDSVSNLDRLGVFRLNVGIGKQTFQPLFGTDAIESGVYDFTALDTIMPHPHYAAQHFVCVLNPSDATWEKVKAFLADAYEIAKKRSKR